MTKQSGGTMVGTIILVLAGIATIGTAVVTTQVPTPLLALLLVGWGVQTVRSSRLPLLAGTIVAIAYVAVGAAIFYTGEVKALWAMIFANWLGEAVAHQKNTGDNQEE